MTHHSVELEPSIDVEHHSSSYFATTANPWLKLRFATGLPAGSWVTLSYRASYFDQLTRPIVRLVTPAGNLDQPTPAPLFGRATWIGFVPHDTHEMLISPVDKLGPFGFEVEHFGPLSRAALVAKAWSQHPGRTLEAIAMRCIGRRHDARRQLNMAFSSTAFEKYHVWRTARWRDIDLAGLDAPRMDWSQGPHIRIIISAAGPRITHVQDLLNQLAHQPYPHWSVAAMVPVPSTSALHAAGLDAAMASGRLRVFDADADVIALCSDLSDEDLIGAIDSCDRLPAYGLAVLAEHARLHAATSVFYGDEEAIDSTGRHVDPRLKPDWSPVFEATAQYVGSALFVRHRWLSQRTAPRLRLLAEGGLDWLLADVHTDDVTHIRRVILTRAPHRSLNAGRRPERSKGPSVCTDDPDAGRPCATIIIPSKDRADLLAACVRSLDMALASDDEVIIVDNGSVEAKTQRLYSSLKADGRYRVIDRPGPFNFSLLCNEAAREARGTVLVFLNNDITALDGAWLEPMLLWALRPDLGAVGAKLLYPSGRLQHGGVVIGLGGSTAHIDRGSKADEPGWQRRLSVPHEVSAVTGACLAVEKAKFDAVGGFDAEHFPIELNDIDLCLRLAALGWRTLQVAQSVLVHRESASRGTSTAQSGKYARERAIFANHWGERLRDDPYFHPALSLVSVRLALG